MANNFICLLYIGGYNLDKENTICKITNIFSVQNCLRYGTAVQVISYNFYKLINISVVYSVNIDNDLVFMLDNNYKIVSDCVCMQCQCPFLTNALLY